MFLLDISKPVCVQSKNVISTACNFVLNNLLCRFVLFSLMESVRVLVTYVVVRGIFAVIWGRNSRVEHLLVDDFPIIIHNDI